MIALYPRYDYLLFFAGAQVKVFETANEERISCQYEKIRWADYAEELRVQCAKADSYEHPIYSSIETNADRLLFYFVIQRYCHAVADPDMFRYVHQLS